MSFGLAGPSVPTIYSKRSHPAVKRPGGAPSTAWGSETASSYQSGYSRRGSFGSSHASSSITPRTHPGGLGGGVPSSSNWEYADEVVSSLKFLRPFVIAAEEDVLAKNALAAASSCSSPSSPAPVVSDMGERVEQGKMTAMEKEVFTIMETYVEHKMKKKRGGKGKKEAEVGKKLEIIEDQFLDCPTYVKLFRKIKIQYSLPLPPAPPTPLGSPESTLSPPLPAHLSSPTESGFSSDRPLLPPHTKNGSLDTFGSLLNPSFSLGTRRAGGPKHGPASSNGHGNGQGHSPHSSLSSFTPSLTLEEIPMPPGMTLNPDRTFVRKPSLGKISSALTFGGKGGEPEITWPLLVDEGKKIAEGKRAEVMKARLIETFLASGVSGGQTMIPTRPQRPGGAGGMDHNLNAIPDWSHLPPVPSHPQSSAAVTGINRSVKDEITLSPSDRACARRLSAALKAMDRSIGDEDEKDDDEAGTGRSSLPSGPSSFRLGSAEIRGVPIPHRAHERESQGEDGGEGLISDTFEADMFGTSPDQSSGLGIVNTLPVRSSSRILGTAPPPSAPLPSIPSATEEEDGMGLFTAVKPRPRSDSNSSLSLERRRAVFLASSEEGVVGSSRFLADDESGFSTVTTGQPGVGAGTGRRIRSVDDAMTALSARKSSLTGSAATSDPPGGPVSAPTYRSHSSWSRSSAGGTRLSDLLEEGEEMEDTVPHRMSSTGTLDEDVASPALSSGGDRYSMDSHEMTLATPQGEYNFQAEFSNRKMQFDGNVETMADELFYKSPKAARRDSSVLQPGWI